MNARGADFDAPEIAEQYVDAGQSIGGALGAIVGAINLVAGGQRRITVHAIEPGDELYLLGDTQKLGDGSIDIARSAHKLFISTRTEDQLVGSLGWQIKALYVVGVILVLGGLWFAMNNA